MTEEISEASRRRAEAAKQYIEQKYKAKENENKERFTRCEAPMQKPTILSLLISISTQEDGS